MFARILEFPVRMEKKEEFVSLFKNEVLPILKKQPGFLEMIPLFPEIKKEKVITISLWTDKRDAERYHRNAYPEIHQILKPYLLAAVEVKPYLVETALCEHFVHALAA
jgi:heme-degrading monooxygenase HmoA